MALKIKVEKPKKKEKTILNEGDSMNPITTQRRRPKKKPSS